MHYLVVTLSSEHVRLPSRVCERVRVCVEQERQREGERSSSGVGRAVVHFHEGHIRASTAGDLITAAFLAVRCLRQTKGSKNYVISFCASVSADGRYKQTASQSAD